MAQYIDKDALVAEIERRITLFRSEKSKENASVSDKLSLGGRIAALEEFKVFIDTLEVKEVDLEEAARKWEDKVYLEKGWQDEYGIPHAPFSEIGNAFREGAKFILKAQKGE